MPRRDKSLFRLSFKKCSLVAIMFKLTCKVITERTPSEIIMPYIWIALHTLQSAFRHIISFEPQNDSGRQGKWVFLFTSL